MTTQIPDSYHVLEFPYTRTTGPVVGPFLTALRDGKILGSRIDGKVYCPPLEYHPTTAAAVESELVEVGPSGTILSWTWVAHPTPKHPLSEPFAFALIQLDGADTPLAHAVKVASSEAISTGARVTAQWREECVGAITDVYFVPEADAEEQKIEPGEGDVIITEHLISLTISEPLHPHRRRFAEGLLEGKIIGQRSPASGKLYVPGRGYDPMERIRLDQSAEEEVADVGTVVGFTEINPVQYHGQKERKPYIRCSILLDDSDQPIQGIDIRHIGVDDFRVGMRLRAVWKAPEDRYIEDLDNRYGTIPDTVVERWDPTGEPDVEPDMLKEHTI